MDLVRRDVRDAVLVRARVAGQHALELVGLARDALFRGQRRVLAVRDAPHVAGQAARHDPVLRVHHEVEVVPAEAGESVGDLAGR